MPDWKEQFDISFPDMTAFFEGNTEWEARQKVKSFISTEIIEKLIADIPDVVYAGLQSAGNFDVKQQLRDKWL